MSIEKRIERIEAILDARGLDWDHPRVEDEPLPVDFGDKDHPVVMRQTMVFSLSQSDKNQPVKEPPKKWRILEPGEVVCSSDRVKAKTIPPSDPPDGLGWRPVDASVGTSVCEGDPCIFARPVADELAKEAEPEHPAGPQPDPGEGYRLLSKDPPEDLRDGDEFFHSTLGRWRESIHAAWGYKRQDPVCWYRRKIEPAKEPEPAWEPKVGDWVKVTRPENWKECRFPYWPEKLNEYDGQVGQIEFDCGECFQIRGFVESDGFQYKFHRDWLSPAEPPATEKPPEPEYREPVLPADEGKWCEFSEDGRLWVERKLLGYRCHVWLSVSMELGSKAWVHARIKKDA